MVPSYSGIDGTGKLKELAHDAGRPRRDVWENAVWADSVTARGRDCYFIQAIHQEADVIPENVDAVRALNGEYSAEESIARTNETLGIGFTRFDERARQVKERQPADD